MRGQQIGHDDSIFLGDLSILHLNTEYRSLKEDPVRDFYRPCLLHANKYRRAVGFFRSTIYDVVGPPIVEFARRRGRTELICSPELSEEDIDSIALGYARKSEVVEKQPDSTDRSAPCFWGYRIQYTGTCDAYCRWSTGYQGGRSRRQEGNVPREDRSLFGWCR